MKLPLNQRLLTTVAEKATFASKHWATSLFGLVFGLSH